MKDSNFLFDCVDLLHYKCHKISLNRGGSYIEFIKILLAISTDTKSLLKKTFM